MSNSTWEKGYGEDCKEVSGDREESATGHLLIPGRGSREPLKCVTQEGKQGGRDFTVAV